MPSLAQCRAKDMGEGSDMQGTSCEDLRDWSLEAVRV